MRVFISYIICVLLLFANIGFAANIGETNNKKTTQSAVTSDDPDVLYRRKFYKEALTKYLSIFQQNKDDIGLMYKIGMCYLHGTLDYQKGIPFLKKAAESGKSEPEAYYMLGKSFQNALMFDNAIDAYSKSISFLNEKSWGGDEIEEIKLRSTKEIENCNYAKKMITNPIDVTFENLGSDVNTPFVESDPYITPNKTELVFSSNRADGNQCAKPTKLGYSYDVYMSIYKTGKWNKSFNMGPTINTPLNERVSSISTDGQTMFLYIDNEESSKDGDIYVATQSAKSFTTPINLKGLVNSSSEESSASINFDGTKLYFASDRDGGFGGKDIYVAKKMPTGDWAEPKKLSDLVNTKLNEDYPVIMPDDKTLYFASEGHSNYGGYDIFKCEWVDTLNNWSEPENIGYPVNTPQDNLSISITDKLHEGYISAIRPEGFGDYDIYKIIFNEAQSAPYFILRAKINTTDPIGINTDVHINVISKKTEKIVAKYNIAAKKKGDFFGIFHAGDYTFEINNEQCKPFSTDVSFIDKNIRGELVKKDFLLSSIKDAAPIETPKKEIKGNKKDLQKKKQ